MSPETARENHAVASVSRHLPRCSGGRPCGAPAVLLPLILAACAGLASTAGCRKTETRLEIQYFKDPQAPGLIHEDFEPGAFATDAHGDWDIVFEISPKSIDVGGNLPLPHDAPRPAMDGQAEDAAHDEVRVAQLLHINMFWRPRPGTTPAESTQTDATIIYCLIRGRDLITYEGAGFIYFKRSRDGATIEGRIESSNLTPTRRVNEDLDLFGPCRVVGSFIAHNDRKRVVSVIKALRRRLSSASPISSTVGAFSPIDTTEPF